MLVDSLVNYDVLAPQPKMRQRKWAQKVHYPMDVANLPSAIGLPYGCCVG